MLAVMPGVYDQGQLCHCTSGFCQCAEPCGQQHNPRITHAILSSFRAQGHLMMHIASQTTTHPARTQELYRCTVHLTLPVQDELARSSQALSPPGQRPRSV